MWGGGWNEDSPKDLKKKKTKAMQAKTIQRQQRTSVYFSLQLRKASSFKHIALAKFERLLNH